MTGRFRHLSGRVLWQMATVGVATGVVKVAGAAKVILMARAFGMSDGLDAYLIAFVLPSFVADTLTGSLAPALVPAFIEARQKQGRDAALRLYASVLRNAAGLLAVVALVLAALAPWVLRPLASGFDAAKLSLTVKMFLLILPMAPLSALGMTWRAILNSEDRFVVAALAAVATPLVSILFLLEFGRKWGVYSLAAGTLTGGVLETAILAVAIASCGFPVVPRIGASSAAFGEVLRQYVPLVAGTLLLGGAPMIDQAIAAMLGSGSVAALNYGTRLSTVLVAVGPVAVATAILPHFSRLTAADEWRAARRSLRAYALVIVAVTLPAIALLIGLSQPIVRLFFERGQFTGAATELVAAVQRYSLLQIPPAMVLALVLRFVSSMKLNHLLLRAAALSLALNLMLDLTLGKWIGVAGIALSAAIVQSVALLYLIGRLRASPAIE
jgi:putative peptidoglycan lipid II flippase